MIFIYISEKSSKRYRFFFQMKKESESNITYSPDSPFIENQRLSLIYPENRQNITDYFQIFLKL